MKFKLSKIYETWTDEAVEYGETDDKGYEYQDQEFDTLDDVVNEITSEGYVEYSSSEYCEGGWHNTVDDDINYATGERTIYSFHLVNLGCKEKLVYEMIQDKQK